MFDTHPANRCARARSFVATLAMLAGWAGAALAAEPPVSLLCDESLAACAPLLEGAEWVEEYGSFVVWRPGAASQRPQAAGGVRVRRLPAELHLGRFRHDATGVDPAQSLAASGGWTETPREFDAWVVQFAAPIRQRWLDQLRAGGLQPVMAIPARAVLVLGSPEAAARARLAERVDAVVRLQPAHKLPAELLWAVGASTPPGTHELGRGGRARYDIAVAKLTAPASIESEVALTGGRVLARLPISAASFDLLRVELPPAGVRALAALPGVLRIDPYVPPTAEDERSAQIVAGNYTSSTTIAPPGYDPATQFGVDGSGVTVAIADDGIGIPGDGGFYITSANAVDGPLRGAPSGAVGHGHLVATVVAGTTPFANLDPAGYNYALGVAPGAHVVNLPILCADQGYCSTQYTGTDSDAANDAVSTPGPNGVAASISNNSWGNGLNGNSYDGLAAAYDGLTHDASQGGGVDPLLFVFSAGNAGTTGLTRPKMAKNVIAVANSKNLRPEIAAGANNMDDLSSDSSRGPAADGRIKPDLTAPGTIIVGGRSGPGGGTSLDAAHRWTSGTSLAAPHVAAAAALFTEWWRDAHAGGTPSPALIKAALINGAVEVTGVGALAPVPNGAEGWGRLHLGNVLGADTPRAHRDGAALLSEPGEEVRERFTVADDDRPLRVTLVWSDPPGLVDPALVNDLDLEVEVGATIYRGNVFDGGLSVPGGSGDRVNNVENVWLPAGLAVGTPVLVRVRALELAGDGAVGEGDATDQRFALVISNAVPTAGAALRILPPTITGESCQPANGAADPGEAMLVELCLENVGSAASGELTVTLAPSDDVDPIAPTASYGVLPAGGGALCRGFDLALASGAVCGEAIDLALSVVEGELPGAALPATLTLGELVAATPATFTNSAQVQIADVGAAETYPSEIAIAGTFGTIVDLELELHAFGHDRTGDLDLRLVAPNGTAATLMSDVGGASDVNNLDLVLDDDAAVALPLDTDFTSGSYRPADYPPADSFVEPAPEATAAQRLSSFHGLTADGNWQLYLHDDSALEGGRLLQGWSLVVTTAARVCATDCPLLFRDGFERGDTSRWSVTVEDPPE